MITQLNMTDAEFSLYQKFIYSVTGINISSAKKNLVINRLAKRLRALKISSFRIYREFVLNDSTKTELANMIDLISTNKTEFFRENKHFKYLIAHVYPNLFKRHKVRIWSAGCSSGEEPYSIAMTIQEYLKNDLNGFDIKILATDISLKILYESESGIYSKDKVSNISKILKSKHFLKGEEKFSDFYLVKENLKNMIRFRHLNLMEDFPMKGLFDIIFCRNVMIYFDKATQGRLIEKFSRQLNKGGYLFIGHSETLSGIKTDLEYVLPTIYRKI